MLCCPKLKEDKNRSIFWLFRLCIRLLLLAVLKELVFRIYIRFYVSTFTLTIGPYGFLVEILADIYLTSPDWTWIANLDSELVEKSIFVKINLFQRKLVYSFGLFIRFWWLRPSHELFAAQLPSIASWSIMVFKSNEGSDNSYIGLVFFSGKSLKTCIKVSNN